MYAMLGLEATPAGPRLMSEAASLPSHARAGLLISGAARLAAGF